jgi:hypothetical protein
MKWQNGQAQIDWMNVDVLLVLCKFNRKLQWLLLTETTELKNVLFVKKAHGQLKKIKNKNLVTEEQRIKNVLRSPAKTYQFFKSHYSQRGDSLE